jgi:hypothetical protein
MNFPKNPDSNVPMSARIEELSRLATERPLSLSDVEEILSEKGAEAVICLLCLPFLFPIPIPGISTAFGGAIMLLTLKIVMGSSAKLPARLGQIKLPAELFKSIATKSQKFVLWLERWLKPRAPLFCHGFWLWIAGASLLSSAIALALPIPPVIPLTNTIPALAIFLVALGLMEEDGIMVWLGHLTGIASWVYLAAVGGAAWAIFGKFIDWVVKIYQGFGA